MPSSEPDPPPAASPEPAIGVVVAHSHPLYRDALARTIAARDTLALVAVASDGPRVLAAVRRHRPEVAVIELDLSGLDVERMLDAVAHDGLPTRLAFIGAADSAVAYRLIGAGAAAYLTKDADQEKICEAVLAVARGQIVLSPAIQAGIASEIRLRANDDRPFLSDREREILKLIAEGLTAPEIGRRIHVSTATVKTHLHHLYRKLDVADRAAAVAEAMRRGLLE